MKKISVLALTFAPFALLPAQEPSPLVVHEWGTFTSMQGTDGVALEGLQHEEEQLPGFVHQIMEVEEAGKSNLNKFPASRVTQKMETPVIYFHTEVPRRVHVEVDFNRGLMTQFYPLPDTVQPPVEKLRANMQNNRFDLGVYNQSTLIWDVDLIPAQQQAPAEIPKVSKDDLWWEARQVRSAYVRTLEDPQLDRKVEAEHYLFYRGLGNFNLPVQVKEQASGVTKLHNGCKLPLPYAVALEVGVKGSRFRELGMVPAQGKKEIGLQEVAWSKDHEKVVGALQDRLLKALVAQGLFMDEARAMVATWSRSWFQSRGSRIIYLLPRADTDRILPLRIKPKPDKLVRVLVGRLEYITPQVVQTVEAALLDRLQEDPQRRQHAEQTLRDLDRFLEPHVRRVLATTSNAEVQKSGRQVLQELTED